VRVYACVQNNKVNAMKLATADMLTFPEYMPEFNPAFVIEAFVQHVDDYANRHDVGTPDIKNL